MIVYCLFLNHKRGEFFMKMQFANLWEKVSDIVPDDPALINSKKVVTWKEYDIC